MVFWFFSCVTIAQCLILLLRCPAHPWAEGAADPTLLYKGAQTTPPKQPKVLAAALPAAGKTNPSSGAQPIHKPLIPGAEIGSPAATPHSHLYTRLK